MTLVQELTEYCNGVLKDEPLSCQKHKWACQRFLSDLQRQGTPDFPYVFLPEKAERFYNWCELFRHTKGVLAGKGIKLAPILKFIFGNLYGWYHLGTGYRRFNKLYWQVARKNAKSQMLSLVASYELMAFNETGSEIQEVYCAATKSEQARIVYAETLAMLRKCSALKGKWKEAYGRIKHLKTDSFMRVLSDDDKKSGDGLNPQCGIVDEYHAHPTTEVYDIIDSGMGARSQPILATITTAGFDLNNPCYRVEYQLISNVLNPDIDFRLDNYMIMVNELDKDERGEVSDDIEDPNVWIKANPIICSYPEGIDYISKKIKEAIGVPEKLRNVLTKHLNVWVHLTETSYVSPARWGLCKVDSLPDLKDLTAYVGLDLSSKVDLSSVAIEIPYEDKYIIKSHSFIPEETFDIKMKTDKVPYDVWLKEGWLTVFPGPIVDIRAVIQWVRDETERHGWYLEEWCFDPWSCSQVMSWLIEEGESVVEVRQGVRTLSEPTKDFRDQILKGNIIHDGSPLMSWSIGNAIVDVVDRNENILLNKKKSVQRIDPLAAAINAHVRGMNSTAGSEPVIIIV